MHRTSLSSKGTQQLLMAGAQVAQAVVDGVGEATDAHQVEMAPPEAYGCAKPWVMSLSGLVLLSCATVYFYVAGIADLAHGHAWPTLPDSHGAFAPDIPLWTYVPCTKSYMDRSDMSSGVRWFVLQGGIVSGCIFTLWLILLIVPSKFSIKSRSFVGVIACLELSMFYAVLHNYGTLVNCQAGAGKYVRVEVPLRYFFWAALHSGLDYGMLSLTAGVNNVMVVVFHYGIGGCVCAYVASTLDMRSHVTTLMLALSLPSHIWMRNSQFLAIRAVRKWSADRAELQRALKFSLPVYLVSHLLLSVFIGCGLYGVLSADLVSFGIVLCDVATVGSACALLSLAAVSTRMDVANNIALKEHGNRTRATEFAEATLNKERVTRGVTRYIMHELRVPLNSLVLGLLNALENIRTIKRDLDVAIHMTRRTLLALCRPSSTSTMEIMELLPGSPLACMPRRCSSCVIEGSIPGLVSSPCRGCIAVAGTATTSLADDRRVLAARAPTPNCLACSENGPSSFILSTSHLRNRFGQPLPCVASTADSADDKATEDPLVVLTNTTQTVLEAEEIILNCNAAGLGLGRILDDFLSLDRIEQGQLKLEMEPFKVRQWALKSISLLHASSAAKAITVRLDVAPNMPETIVSDMYKLQQCLCNLLSNAIKFSAQGSTISVACTIVYSAWQIGLGAPKPTDAAVLDTLAFPTLGSKGEGKAKIFEAPADSQSVEMPQGESIPFLRVAVTDAGVGITEEEIHKLFVPFQQIRAGALQKGNGTGLGLSIVKQVIVLCGGSVGVDSKVNRGSTFYFQVPIEGMPVLSSDLAVLVEALPQPSPIPADVTNLERLGAGSGILPVLQVEKHPSTLLDDMVESSTSPRQRTTLLRSMNAPELPGWDTVCSSDERPSRMGSYSPPSPLRSTASMSRASFACTDKGSPSPMGTDSLLSRHSVEVIASIPESITLEPLHFAVICDDIATNLKFFRRLLSNRGCEEVLQVADGKEAVALAEHLLQEGRLMNVQAWFFDESMPLMNGSEAIRRIRGMGVTALMVSITGNSLQEDQALMFEAGADAVCTKPVRLEMLDQALRKAGMCFARMAQ